VDRDRTRKEGRGVDKTRPSATTDEENLTEATPPSLGAWECIDTLDEDQCMHIYAGRVNHRGVHTEQSPRRMDRRLKLRPSFPIVGSYAGGQGHSPETDPLAHVVTLTRTELRRQGWTRALSGTGE